MARAKAGAKPSLAQTELLDVGNTTAPAVPQIRRRVAEWREAGYPGTTETTRVCFAHWFPKDGHRRPGRAPFRYQSFRAGGRIAPDYYGPRYVIADPWRYHLPAARPGLRYVRHYNDVLLVDYRRGYVVDVIRSFYY